MGTFIRSSVVVKRDYEKLAITASLKILSTGAGLTQGYKDGAFSPDHGVTPLVLTPVVEAKASDITPEQVWSVGNSASDSGNGGTAWKVDGVAISSAWTEGTDYELSDDGKKLYIYRNITAGTTASVKCAVLVYDSRTGITIAAETDAVELATVAVAEAQWRLSLDHGNVLWDVTADDLWEWEYRDARGLAQKMTEAAATNDGCYKKTVAFCVTHGGGQLSSGYGIWINDSSGDNVAYVTAGGDVVNNQPVKILELTTAGVTFDCRVIEDEAFTVYAMDEESAIIYETKSTVHVKATRRTYDAPEPVNSSDYTTRQTKYRNSLRVRCNGEEWDYPECWLAIVWKTLAATANAEEVEVGAGNECVFNPNVAGGGATATDNGFRMIAYTDYHAALQPAADEDGGTLCDEDGSVLLV